MYHVLVGMVNRHKDVIHRSLQLFFHIASPRENGGNYSEDERHEQRMSSIYVYKRRNAGR